MKKITFILIALLFGLSSYAQQLAFPSAEGYGKYVTGGRGGAVYEVTNLNASGTGSLGAAISASGPRTVVFRVSGTIAGNFNIKNGNITIAGQTAPGDGICIKGNLSTSADNIIIRYIRVRNDPVTNTEADATGGRYHTNIIYDHVSASWSTDEVFSLYHNTNVTIQWCMITEACPKIVDGVNTGHRFGGIWGNQYGTYHHNLIADNDSRNMRWASGSKYNDYRNNVIYNWGYNSSYGGGAVQSGVAGWDFTTVNMIANYYKPGPATESGVARRIVEPTADGGVGSFYVSGNYVDGYPDVTTDNWKGVDGNSYIKMTAPWDAMPINQQTPQNAYIAVLTSAGCSYPKRDKVDADIIDDVMNGTAKYGNKGIINSPSDVGGWPTLNSTTPPTDTDHDGMPDAWETERGLNPNDASDRNKIGPDGYTMLEEYIDGLVDTPIPATGVTVDPTSIKEDIGQTTQIQASVVPYNATNQLVSWSSSDTTVAKVSSTGVVTGISHGSAVITATTKDGGFTADCNVTIAVIPVTGVSVSPSETNVSIASTTKLTAVFSPSNASNQNVSWSSSDTTVATVNASGMVKGVALGTAVITATTEDGSYTATSTVTVSALPTPLVQLDFNDNGGNNVANTGSLPVTFTKTDGVPTWSSNVPENGGASSLDYGTTDGAYYVESDTMINELAGMADFTVIGWVNCRDISIGSGGNRIVTWINSGGDGVDIVHDANGSLKVGINEWPDKTTAISTTGEITADASAGASNWKFFAVTYQSETDTLNMYFGDNTTAATLDKSFNYAKGSVGKNIGHLCIGQFNAESRHYGNNRMFKGLIDGVRIYNTALSLNQVRSVQSDAATGLMQPTSNETGVKVYPNPFTNELNIGVNGMEGKQVNVDIYNLMGRLVASSGNVIVSGNKINLTNNRSLDELPVGGYIGVLRSDNQTISKFKLFKGQR